MTNFQIVGLAALPLLISAQTDSGRIVVAEPSGKTTEIVMPAAAPATAREDVDAARGDDTVVVAGGGSLLEAVTAVIGQLPDKVLNLELLGEEEAAQLAAATNRWAGTGGKRIPWNKALEEVLRPAKLFIFEDGVVVKLGTREQVDALYAAQQAERLANNHTRIDPDFSGGTEIYVALSTIRTLAGVNMNFDYMAPEHRGIVQAAATEQAAEGQVQVAAQPPPGVRTTYAVPPGQKIEWRIVLKEVLDPIGYVFIEDNGTVKPMPTAQLVKFNQAKINAKPLVTKFIKVSHANAETVVEKLKKMGLLKHEKAFMDVSVGKDDNAKTFRGGSGGQLQSGSSGQRIGAQQTGGATFNDLKRPRTPVGILVADIEENIPEIEKSIKLLDVRERQVLIEALILDLSDQMKKELGVKWGDLKMQYNSQQPYGNYTLKDTYQIGSDGTVKMKEITTKTTDGAGNVIETKESVPDMIKKIAETDLVRLDQWSGKIAQNRFAVAPISFDAVIKMIQGDSYSRVLGSPVITVGDHGEAIIQIAKIMPVEQTSVSYDSGAGNYARTATETEWLSLQTGYTLWVSPEISDDSQFVRLSVHPQITEVGDTVYASKKEWQSADLNEREKNYVVMSQELDTRVSVKSGETLLLGGLMKSNQKDIVDKVPLLGDIPFLGRLFRYDGKERYQSHLVLLIRPTVLDEEAPNTGFEEPSMKVFEPMMKGIGKTLDPRKGEDPIFEKEKTLLEKWGWKKKEETEEGGEAAAPVVNHGSTDVEAGTP
jgi:type II secretory pathway component GspD/PulD (secretin)